MGLGAGFYLNATEAPWSAHYHMYDYVVTELPQAVAEACPQGGHLTRCHYRPLYGWAWSTDYWAQEPGSLTDHFLHSHPSWRRPNALGAKRRSHST